MNSFIDEIRASGDELSPPEFSELFREAWGAMSSSFFKFEWLQFYSEPADPSYQALKKGEFYRAVRLVRERILRQQDMYERALAAGIALTRVRAVDRPLTRYLEYEFISYLTSAEIGETILIAERSAFKDGDAEWFDFVLFDEHVAFVHDYRKPDHAFVGARRVDDPEIIARLIAKAAEAQLAAVPLESFRLSESASNG